VAAAAAQTVVMIGAVQSAFFGMRWYQRWWWVLSGRLPQLPLAQSAEGSADRKVA